MKKNVEQYIRNCHVCKRLKALKDCYNKILKSLSILKRLWTDITLDFVINLPKCELKNTILMVVNYLAKKQVYIPCNNKDNGTNAEATAKMLLRNV